MNTLYYGDNLDILRNYIADESVDLIYLDPPFNSNRDYNVLFKDESSGDYSQAQITAFEDTWHWDYHTQNIYEELITGEHIPSSVSSMIAALREFIGTNQMMAYLVNMTIRLVELHRVLKSTGSLYLHCDPTASHYLKIVLDTLFEANNFRNEIIWQRTSSHNDSKKWGSVHDVILYYGKSNNIVWNPVYMDYDQKYLDSFYNKKDSRGIYRLDHIIRSESMGPRPNLTYEYKGYIPKWGWRVVKEKLIKLDDEDRLEWSKTGRPYLKRYLHEQKGTPIKSVITDIQPLSAQSAEKLGYPTQKPQGLLERIIKASSNPKDVILDPFCGCGTSIAAAEATEREWIGIDITHLAIALIKYRMTDSFPDVNFEIIGEPESVDSARYLAEADRHQFEWWALSLIRARPSQPDGNKGKKGADRGIDGVINFIDDASGKPQKAIVQVKSGHVSSSQIRDLIGTMNRTKAPIGIFITLEEPTKPMLKEAAEAGFYHSNLWNKDFPKVQILTIGELLDGKEPGLPPSNVSFQKAQRQKPKASGGQLSLLDGKAEDED